MKTIWKYPIAVKEEFTIAMPPGAKILTVQMQGNNPCLWVMFDDLDTAVETRSFIVVGTGHFIPDITLQYIGTFQMANGSLVWHLFEDITEQIKEDMKRFEKLRRFLPGIK